MKELRAKACTLYGGLIYFSPVVDRVLKISIPFLIIITYLLFLWSVFPYEKFLQLGGLMLVYFIPPAGKESIVPAAIELGFDWWVIAVSIVIVDAACCLFMLWNFELVCRLPVLGRWVQIIMQRGHEFLEKHTWLERLYMVGLIFFIFIPFQGTGSVSGTILGKITGLKPIEVFSAVIIGTALSTTLIGLSAYALNHYLSINLWYLVAVILVVVLFISIISYVMIWVKNHFR